mmetsp:Transcript_12516/g.24940  ORF Transcript_12516/g.24940 Transcript_12516/m.24940 type:complete len:130 (-) Transcript_12516:83-472(-)
MISNNNATFERLRETVPEAVRVAVSSVRNEESVPPPPPTPSKRLFWGDDTMDALSFMLITFNHNLFLRAQLGADVSNGACTINQPPRHVYYQLLESQIKEPIIQQACSGSKRQCETGAISLQHLRLLSV